MHIHIIGIAGTMTASLAIALKKQGHIITGSDQEKIYPPISTLLNKAKIDINTTDINTNINLVIVGSSYSSFKKTKDEFDQVKQLHLKYISATEYISQNIIRDDSILIAGTYGKTTISALISWIFHQSRLNPNYMFGGDLINRFPSINMSSSNWSIVEADESIHGLDSQAKFLYYPVKYLLLTSAEWEHQDSYPTEIENFNAFKKLITNVPKDGIIFLNQPGHQIKELSLYANCKIISYNSPNSDYLIQKIKIRSRDTILYIKTPTKIIPFKTKLIGQFNFENILAAVTVCHTLGLKISHIKKAIFKFKGVKRRIEKIYDHKNILIFDDFAQSTTRIKSTIKAIKSHFPQKNIKVLYQPHASFVQYKSAIQDLKSAFYLADEVVVTKINYKNDITKDQRVTAVDFRNNLGSKFLYLPLGVDLIKHYQEHLQPNDILINMSSGGLIGNQLVKSIINSLK